MQLRRYNAGDEGSSSDAWRIAEAPRSESRFNDLGGVGPFPSRLGSKRSFRAVPPVEGFGLVLSEMFRFGLRYDVFLCWSCYYVDLHCEFELCFCLPNTKASSFTSAGWLSRGKKMSNVFGSASRVRGCSWA